MSLRESRGGSVYAHFIEGREDEAAAIMATVVAE